MNLTLVTIAKFSETMLWVVGFLLAANLVAMIIVVVRTGKVDEDEGCVVKEQGALTGNPQLATGGNANVLGAGKYMGGNVNVLGAGMNVVKEKILVDRSEFISDESLVDGTATKSQRLLVHCIQLFFFLFWLLFVFIGLSRVPSQPIEGAFFVIVPTIGFSMAAVGMHRGRTEALRKLKKSSIANG